MIKKISPRIISELENNLTKSHSKKLLLFWSEFFKERGYKCSHLSEISILTISSIIYMINEFYIERPMQRVDLKLNMMNDEKPILIYPMDGSFYQPLIRKYSYLNENTECNR